MVSKTPVTPAPAVVRRVDASRPARCSDVWGGTRDIDLDMRMSGLSISLWSASASGDGGGDIHYISRCYAGVVTRLVIADVAGHGAAVNHLSESLYQSVRAHADSVNGAKVMADLNAIAAGQGLDLLTTAAVFTFNAMDRTLRYCYAGHPPAMIFRRRSGTWAPLSTPVRAGMADLPLAVSPLTAFAHYETTVDAGDRLLAFTDGVPDSLVADGGRFGAALLPSVLDRARDGCVRDLKNAVRTALTSFRGGRIAHDDVTLAAIEFH